MCTTRETNGCIRYEEVGTVPVLQAVLQAVLQGFYEYIATRWRLDGGESASVQYVSRTRTAG